MSRIALDELIHTISQAVHQAQETLSFSHLKHLCSYFETTEEGPLKPRKLQVKLPRQHREEGDSEEAVHEIPHAALTQIQPLALDQLKLELDCLVEGLDDEQPQRKHNLSVPLNPPADPAKNPARLTLHFTTGEVPEGAARLNDELLKTF